MHVQLAQDNQKVKTTKHYVRNSPGSGRSEPTTRRNENSQASCLIDSFLPLQPFFTDRLRFDDEKIFLLGEQTMTKNFGVHLNWWRYSFVWPPRPEVRQMFCGTLRGVAFKTSSCA